MFGVFVGVTEYACGPNLRKRTPKRWLPKEPPSATGLLSKPDLARKSEEVLHQFFHRHSFGLGLVIPHDAVAHDGQSHGAHVFPVGGELAVEGRMAFRADDQKLRRAGPGAPAQVAVG